MQISDCQTIRHNIHGYGKRLELEWILSQIDKGYSKAESGCGTGVMIFFPLAKMGCGILGIDLDTKSIEFGQKFLPKGKISPNTLQSLDISLVDANPDVFIAFQVVEHIESDQLGLFFNQSRKKLKPSGKLLVTVPNGHGWFELERFLWFKTGIVPLLERLKIFGAVNRLKELVWGRENLEEPYSSTPANSPHVQRFTYNSIQLLLRNHGVEVTSITVAVFIAGPFSQLLFGGIKPIVKLNCALESVFSKIAFVFLFFVIWPKSEKKPGLTEI